MTYTVLALIFRKPSLTPQEFRTHYDTVHVPLLKSLVGDLFPLTHTRNYVTRHKEIPDASSTSSTSSSSDTGASLWKPTVYIGEAANFPYDSLTVMVWEDKATFERFKEVFYSDEVISAIKKDEANFIDGGFKMACELDEPSVTPRSV